MRWYVAEDTHGIKSGVIAAGHEVVSVTENERQNFPDLEEHKDYKLKVMMRDAGRFRVMLLGNLDLSIGYSRSAVLPWSGGVRGRVVVGTITQGMESVWRLNNAMRGCIVGASQCSLIVTDSEEAAQALRSSRRVVLLRGSVDPLLEAVHDVGEYKNLDRRFYG